MEENADASFVLFSNFSIHFGRAIRIWYFDLHPEFSPTTLFEINSQILRYKKVKMELIDCSIYRFLNVFVIEG